MKPFGIDVSRHQGLINWEMVKNHENPIVEFVVIRGGISWGYKDVHFDRNWSEAKRLGLRRGAYFVIYPNEDAKQQCDAWLKIIGNDLGELPLTIDVELHAGIHKCTPERYQSVLRNCLIYLEQKTGRKPIIYSRASFVDAYITGPWYKPVPTWYNDYYWWMAQYLLSGEEHQGPPTLSRGISRERVIIHQTSDRGDGPAFGMQSTSLDYNRWQETADITLYEMTSTESEPPEPDDTKYQKLLDWVREKMEILRNIAKQLLGIANEFDNLND